jgi:hypothetical protein
MMGPRPEVPAQLISTGVLDPGTPAGYQLFASHQESSPGASLVQRAGERAAEATFAAHSTKTKEITEIIFLHITLLLPD